MLTRLLSALRTLCKQRADLENDDHIADSEWNALISEQVGELHELADECGMRYFETTATITATGAASYALPTDHLATIRIVPTDSAGRRTAEPLIEVQVSDPCYPFRGDTGTARRFAIIGQTIQFDPNPSSGTYAHVYVPQPADLATAADDTSIDLICPSGLAFVVEGAAAKALRKSETDVQPFMVAREEARERTRTWLMARSLITPRRMMPTNTDDDFNDPFMRGYR